MRDRSTLQTAALVVGAAFLLSGILGFIPGITTDYGDMEFVGEDSEAFLFGFFQTSIFHNIVHLLFGVAGIALSRSWNGARTFLIGGGVIYLVLWIFGLLTEDEETINFIPVNTADDWLHFALGAAMIALGVMFGRREHDRSIGSRAASPTQSS